jgi:hypothetical protein
VARLPEYVELGGDLSATCVYVATSHDGSMAVTRGRYADQDRVRQHALSRRLDNWG